ncbi:tyrosine-type recombinase/integrase [Streptomyces sp. NPDC058220]|uniref:tyrosine-type recombinase/integrase n=1 Tax=Streptomyces sp. NPDC058220 TaxID=3346387 RepID=UPI0036E9E0F7
MGRLEETGSPTTPFRLLDASGEEVPAVARFFRELVANDYSPASVRSYGLALLRWLRFLDAIEVQWDRATRTEVVDFVLWLRQAKKPGRPNRHAGQINAMTKKPHLGTGYAPATIDHGTSVLKEFYNHHLAAGDGPLVNPVPPVRTESGERVNDHHNPLQRFAPHRRAPLRQRRPPRIPKAIPDQMFNELFAQMTSHRDRALLAFFISTGTRASELVGVPREGTDVGQQLIGVVRKGTRVLQWLPASPDAFVWLRLYRQALPAAAPRGPGAPLWVTLRRPFAPLSYDAARMVFNRVNTALGSNWTLHDLRHTAAHRMIQDPALSLTDVQWVLGHARLTTTELYLTPDQDEVIGRMRLHHQAPSPVAVPVKPVRPGEGYRADVLSTLLGLPQ